MNIYITGHKSPDLDSVASAVEYTEFLTKAKRYEGSALIPLIAESANKETEFVFKKFGVDLPKAITELTIDPTDAFILVDHNEQSQRSEKVINEQVIEIIDHHKINVNFTSPVRIDVKPLGSTSSVIYEHYKMYGLKPSKEIMGLMLCAIFHSSI